MYNSTLNALPLSGCRGFHPCLSPLPVLFAHRPVGGKETSMNKQIRRCAL